MAENTILDNVFGVWSGLLEYNYQDVLAIRNKRTKNIIMAISKIMLKKSFTCNKDEKNLINGPAPTIGSPASCLMYKAKCNRTKAKIQKVDIM